MQLYMRYTVVCNQKMPFECLLAESQDLCYNLTKVNTIILQKLPHTCETYAPRFLGLLCLQAKHTTAKFNQTIKADSQFQECEYYAQLLICNWAPLQLGWHIGGIVMGSSSPDSHLTLSKDWSDVLLA